MGGNITQHDNAGRTPGRLPTLRAKRHEVLQAAESYGVRNVRVFGSVARGEDTETSDVDLLVDLDAGRSLLDLGGFLMDARDILGLEVNVVTEAGLRDRVRESVLRDAIPL